MARSSTSGAIKVLDQQRPYLSLLLDISFTQTSTHEQVVSVVFKAENARTFTEILGIDVADRDFNDAPGGIPYEVTGAGGHMAMAMIICAQCPA